MKITRVGLGKTDNHGNWDIYVESDLEEGDTPEKTLQFLEEIIAQRIEKEAEISTLERQKRNLLHDIKALEDRMKQAKFAWTCAKEEWENLVTWAERQGFNVKAKFPDEIYLLYSNFVESQQK